MSKFNGWTNRETWKVSLWLGSDAGLAAMTDEIIVAGGGSAAQLQDAIEEVVLEGVEGLARDLLIGALAEVNWEEIVQHWTE